MISFALMMLISAQDAPTTAPVPTPSPTAKPKKICRNTPGPATGSHFANTRVCKTAEQWARADGVPADEDADGTRQVHN